MEKSPEEALQKVCSGEMVGHIFDVAATPEGSTIDWSRAMSAVQGFAPGPQKIEAASMGQPGRWHQMRFDAADALACLAAAWPIKGWIK